MDKAFIGYILQDAGDYYDKINCRIFLSETKAKNWVKYLNGKIKQKQNKGNYSHTYYEGHEYYEAAYEQIILVK